MEEGWFLVVRCLPALPLTWQRQNLILNYITILLKSPNMAKIDSIMKQDICKKLGQSIRKIRIKKGMTQGDICRATGMDRGYISSLEAGKRNPTIVNIEKIAKSLKINIPDLFL